MKRSSHNPLLPLGRMLVLALLLSWPAALLQAQNFVPPPTIQKYAFYPQGGNFFSDLFPANFVDLNNTTGILAYNGSDYTYNGHLGCDTEILGFPAQAVGVPIFAVLDGTVTAAHDGEPDMNTSQTNVPPSNYVTLSHGNGQTTTYLHMKKGSVAVAVGQQVRAGQQIGLTGSSGDSTAPHLHFQSAVNGVVYEPFAGPARPGISGWVSQPPFRTDLYMREIVLTNQSLNGWPGYPFDTTRTGTFLSGVQLVSVWFLLGNSESVTSITANYVRPDGTIAFTSSRFPVNSRVRNISFGFGYNINLDVTGTWKLQVLINDQVFTEAPFNVVSSAPFPNHAPGAVQAVLDPITPGPNNVVFCRITSPTTYLDPDYDLVRYHYVWKVNNTVVRDIISAGLADAIPRGTVPAAGAVTCTVTTSDGKVSGPSTVVTPVGRLTNISTRMEVLTGGEVAIGGFIINGSGTKQVLLRALGPTLFKFGVAGFLPDPVLTLHRTDAQGHDTVVATNDNWKVPNQAAIQATGKAPPNDAESAILATLGPGNYTAVLSGKGSATGVALVEAYDQDQSATNTLRNISTRGFVSTGNNVMIGGFISGGGAPTSVIVRALGPTLSQFGVPSALANPLLEIHDANGVLLASNDNWQTSTQSAAIQASGYAPPNANEPAIIITRPAGNTTAIVKGVKNTTGNALVEVYTLP